MSIHIVRTEDMERHVGKAMRVGDPVHVMARMGAHGGRGPLVALCGLTVGDERGTYAEAATFRALEQDPSRFELETMHRECMRLYAIERGAVR